VDHARARPHERFAATVTLTPPAVSAYAHTVGDANPVHHDAEFAAQNPLRRLIASGTQTTAH